ncbi:nucleotide-binding oligomerization domain-containing protein 1-like [Dysidea avara]|uniref:nucleotide-binding oligomerization domain-containing protein 1-like n=1 Tax=Dysidea avara TaxID=196820 RepID=UPI00332411F4
MFNHYVTLSKGQRPSFKLFLRSGNEAITIDDKFLEDKLQRLRFYRIFYEAGDISTCKTIEEKFTDKEIILPGTLSPNNLEDLTTLLTCSSCRNWMVLDLDYCHIQDYGLQLLHRSLHHSNITIDHLWLRNNDLSSSSDSSLSDIIITCKVKWLDISYNKAVGETPHFFTNILTHPSCVIEVLYMYSNNYSTTRPVMELFSSLRENKTVKELWIIGNNISDDECGVICDVLHVNHTLRVLYMSDNPITGQASQLILDAIKNNNTLEQLCLPSYPEDIKKEITSLEQVVNEKRRRRGCDVKLEIGFW